METINELNFQGYEEEVFTGAEKKAFLNAFLIPAVLSAISGNVLVGLMWVLFLTLLYLTIQKVKEENAKAFFTFLKYMLSAFGVVILAGLTLITTGGN